MKRIVIEIEENKYWEVKQRALLSKRSIKECVTSLVDSWLKSKLSEQEQNYKEGRY